MMNEFIVWDKKRKEFQELRVINYRHKIVDMTINNGMDTEWEDFEDVDIFQYIGKTDIEGNKIYADSSIVEFEHKSSRTVMKHEQGYISKQPFIEFENITFKAYFQYHTDELRYELIILDYDKSKTNSIFSVLSFNMETMSNFKIIGTLQQDKELLNG